MKKFIGTLSTALLLIGGLVFNPIPAQADPQLSYTIDCALPVDQQEGTWVGSNGNYGRNVNLGGAATYTVQVTMKNCEYHMWGTYGGYQYNNWPGGSDRTGISDVRTYQYTLTSNYFSNARFSGYNIWGALPQQTTFQMNVSNYLAAPSRPSTPNLVVGDGKVTVTPVDSGTGGTPTYFTVTASPGGRSCTVTLPATSCEVTGLTNGTAYTFVTTATNGGGTSAGSTATTAVTPHVDPTISAIAPSSGSILGGTTLTINGTGFLAGASVNVGGASCAPVTLVSSTQITCVTPAGSLGAANVEVTNVDTGTTASTGAFTYNAISTPTVGGTSPAGGLSTGGTILTISGTGFVDGATVTVGGSSCTNVTFVSSTNITCVSPAGSPSTSADVTVTNPDTGTATQNSGFSYFSAPQIGGVSPASGPTEGGTTLTLTGTGFVNGATVTIGGVPCSPVTVVSATSITCISASSTAGSKDITVTNPDSGSVSALAAFRYNSPMPAQTPPNRFVTFDPNGGFGNSLTIGSNSSAPLPLSEFSRKGYVFIGWNTKADGSGVSYADRASFDFGSDLTLYAQWTLVSGKKVIKPFASNKATLTAFMKVSVSKWVKALPKNSMLVCQGSTSGIRITDFDKKLAASRAKNVCAYAEKVRKDLTYKITVKPSSSTAVSARNVWMFFD